MLFLFKKQRLNKYKNKTVIHNVYKTFRFRDKQTESEGMEK